ncbi:hypothetical protein PILCRDRAFT_57401, partial [Piloderma croceum F 1598]
SSEGTKHGCGHYRVTKKLRKHDCGSRVCALSTAHNPNCPDCPCDKFYGPDIKETVTVVTPSYCPHCEYWFKGPGSIPRKLS